MDGVIFSSVTKLPGQGEYDRPDRVVVTKEVNCVAAWFVPGLGPMVLLHWSYGEGANSVIEFAVDEARKRRGEVTNAKDDPESLPAAP